MFESIDELSQLAEKQESFYSQLEDSIEGYIKNGIECAYENQRYFILPGADLESNISFDKVAPTSLAFGLKHLESLVKEEAHTEDIFIKYIISGDTSKDEKITERFYNMLASSFAARVSDPLSFKEEKLYKLIKSSKLCIKKYCLRGLKPISLMNKWGSAETLLKDKEVMNFGSYIPLKAFSFFIKSKLTEVNLIDVLFPLLVVFENTKNTEEQYFGLLFFNSKES